MTTNRRQVFKALMALFAAKKVSAFTFPKIPKWGPIFDRFERRWDLYGSSLTPDQFELVTTEKLVATLSLSSFGCAIGDIVNIPVGRGNLQFRLAVTSRIIDRHGRVWEMVELLTYSQEQRDTAARFGFVDQLSAADGETASVYILTVEREPNVYTGLGGFPSRRLGRARFKLVQDVELPPLIVGDHAGNSWARQLQNSTINGPVDLATLRNYLMMGTMACRAIDPNLPRHIFISPSGNCVHVTNTYRYEKNPVPGTICYSLFSPSKQIPSNHSAFWNGWYPE